jgi:rubrerythrin
MQLTQRIPFRTERTRRERPDRHRHHRAEPASAASRSTRDQARVGAPEDRATYNCECGYIFKAEVTTTVGCPHCGTQLAW